MLELENLHTYYGSSHILRGVSLRVNAGEVVTLLGRNGMGKTTTLRSILGLTAPRQGRVMLTGQEVTGAPPHRIAGMGIGYVPEGRHIFPTLTVMENLTMALRPPRPGAPGWELKTVFALFPRLGELRRSWGNQLSGGEAQMLSIGRALLTQPRLLLLDEATEGLSPLVRQEIWTVIGRIKSSGTAILIVDKHIHPLLRLAARHVVLNKGQVVFHGTSAELEAHSTVLHEHLGI
ncbi:MAG: ABC transporter ATP-binding protein [Deltaproteobacteria bacterium]|nr:ABC transporter ATP-binding protein [Deltaproteobacteria bacterium]